MHRTNRANLDPIDQLENIHAHQNLRTNNQDIPQRDHAPLHIRRPQRRGAERHVDERIHRHDQDQSLRQPGYMVIDEPAALDLVETRVLGAVEAAHEEEFEDVLFDEEEDDEGDGEDEHAEGGEFGEGLRAHVLDVVVALSQGGVDEVGYRGGHRGCC